MSFSKFQVSIVLRIMSKNVLPLKLLYERFSVFDSSLSLSEFEKDFNAFSVEYLTPYKNKYKHLLFPPIYLNGVKYFLRQTYFYFPGYSRGYYYYLSSMNFNLFHDFLMSVLSDYIASLKFHFQVHYGFAGRELSNDLVIPSLNVAFEVETGLKSHNLYDLNQRLGIVPINQEDINKRFINEYYTYILVANNDIKERYVKYYSSLSENGISKKQYNQKAQTLENHEIN